MQFEARDVPAESFRSDVPVYDSALVSYLAWTDRYTTDLAFLDMLALDDSFPMAAYWSAKPDMRRYIKRINSDDPAVLEKHQVFLRVVEENQKEDTFILIRDNPNLKSPQIIKFNLVAPRGPSREVYEKGSEAEADDEQKARGEGGRNIEVLVPMEYSTESEEAVFALLQPKFAAMGLSVIDKEYIEAKWHFDIFGLNEVFSSYSSPHPWILPLMLEEFLLIDDDAGVIAYLGTSKSHGEDLGLVGLRSSIKKIDSSGSSINIMFKYYTLAQKPTIGSDNEEERRYHPEIEVELEVRELYKPRYLLPGSDNEREEPVGVYYLRVMMPRLEEEIIGSIHEQFMELFDAFRNNNEFESMIQSIEFHFQGAGDNEPFRIDPPEVEDIQRMQEICPSFFPTRYSDSCEKKRYPTLIVKEEEVKKIDPSVRAKQMVEITCNIDQQQKGEKIPAPEQQKVWMLCPKPSHPYPRTGKSKVTHGDYYCCFNIKGDRSRKNEETRARSSYDRKKETPLPHKEEQDDVSNSIRDILVSLGWKPTFVTQKGKKPAGEKSEIIPPGELDGINFYRIGSPSKLSVIECLEKVKKARRGVVDVRMEIPHKDLLKALEALKKNVNTAEWKNLFRQELYEESDAYINEYITQSTDVNPTIWVRPLEEHYHVNIFLFALSSNKKLEPVLPKHVGPYYKEKYHDVSVMLLYHEEREITELLYYKYKEASYILHKGLTDSLIHMNYFVQGLEVPPPFYAVTKPETQIIDVYGKARAVVRRVSGQDLLFVFKRPQAPSVGKAYVLGFETPKYEIVPRTEIEARFKVVQEYENFVETRQFYIAVDTETSQSVARDPLVALVCAHGKSRVKEKLLQKRGTNVMLHYVMYLFMLSGLSVSEFARSHFVVRKTAKYDFVRALTMPESFPADSIDSLVSWISSQNLGLVDVSGGTFRILLMSEEMQQNLTYFLHTLEKSPNISQIKPVVAGYYFNEESFDSSGNSVMSIGDRNPLQRTRYVTQLYSSEMRDPYFVVYRGYLYLVQNVLNRREAARNVIDNWETEGVNTGYMTIIRELRKPMTIKLLDYSEISEENAGPTDEKPAKYYIGNYAHSYSAMIRLRSIYWHKAK